jgi:hypothetical protein
MEWFRPISGILIEGTKENNENPQAGQPIS